MADDDLEEWLAGISGKRPPRGRDDEAAALREVLRARASRASGSNVPDSDIASSGLVEQRLLKRLRDEGLEPRGAPRPATPRVWAVAASFALVTATLVWQTWLPEIAYVDTRGFVGSLRITSRSADADVRRVLADLESQGLKPERKAYRDGVVVDVQVTAAQLPEFGRWMERQGGVARAAGVYRIVVEIQR